MDFSRLPDNAFLKIIDYLSLKDQIRVRRVAKSFQRIGQLAISRTKWLDLTEDCFKNLAQDKLAIILELCSPNLERIKFTNDWFNRYPVPSNFATYECPRLMDLDIGYADVNSSIFDRLSRNAPKIETLVWPMSIIGFSNVVINSMKKVDLGFVNDETLQSLTGRFPNLVEVVFCVRTDTTGKVLDEFFASVPQMRRIDIEMCHHMYSPQIHFEKQLVTFWNLQLTSLRIKFSIDDFPGDSFLHKVATSFPHLQSLRISPINATKYGVAALVALEELEILELRSSNEIDNGIRQLVGCKKLRKLDIRFSEIKALTFLSLFRRCSQLDHVMISGIVDVNEAEEAAVVLQSLSRIAKRHITIEIHSNDEVWFKNIWESEPVTAAIKELEETDSVKIEIGWKEMEHDDNNEDMGEDEDEDEDDSEDLDEEDENSEDMDEDDDISEVTDESMD